MQSIRAAFSSFVYFLLVMSLLQMALERIGELPNGGKRRRLCCESESLHFDMTHRAAGFKFGGKESIIHMN